jgi:hypothetical protein
MVVFVWFWNHRAGPQPPATVGLRRPPVSSSPSPMTTSLSNETGYVHLVSDSLLMKTWTPSVEWFARRVSTRDLNCG